MKLVQAALAAAVMITATAIAFAADARPWHRDHHRMCHTEYRHHHRVTVCNR